jgi:hypothetical protein
MAYVYQLLFYTRRGYATALKDYESLYDILETDPSATKVQFF